jgi:DNA-binding response OmpR family regulator
MDAMLSIIVVEDHDALREVTVEALIDKGHHVIGADCAEVLAEMGNTLHADIVVLDINLPGEDGISLSRRLRESQPDIGIIMVTARIQLVERMQGYESGADLYLTKPASLDELCAAIQSLSRRIKRAAQPASALQIDPEKLTLSGKLGEVSLSYHEAMILVAFARAAGHQLEHWQLIELSGHAETGSSKSTLEVQITRLRKKLVQAGSGEHPIKAIRNLGYQLCVGVQVK